MFDGVHLGHRSLISQLTEQGRRRGLEPIVFTFDRHPLTLIAPETAPQLLTAAADRVSLIRSAGVDSVEVLTFDDSLRRLDARAFMTMLRDRYGVRALLMGFNHRFGCDRLCAFTDYASIGSSLDIEVIRASEWRDSSNGGVCSSAIRRGLRDGDVTRAAAMLGRPYSITGKVVGGRQIGRRLGYPTANIEPADPHQLIPVTGVYAVDVAMPDGSVRRGMANIGYRPTVDHCAKPQLSVEVHIIGWDGDLYGRSLTLRFVSRLRGEMRFDSLEALSERLALDREAALKA